MTERANLSDQMLVKHVLSGDVEHYAVLVERYRTQLARYAVSLCGDSDVAAAAMQASFVRAFESLASCRDVCGAGRRRCRGR